MKRGAEREIKDLQDQGKPKRLTPFTYYDFFKACMSGDVDEVKEGIKCLSPDVIVSPGGFVTENAAFRLACQHGHTAVVILLLEIDAVREAATAYGNDALNGAIRNGHLEIVKLLIKINAVWQNATTSQIYLAAGNGHLAMVRHLLEINLGGHVSVIGGLDFLIATYPKMRESLEREKRLREANAILFAHKSAVNWNPNPNSPLYLLRGQKDVVRIIGQMIKYSPPPVQQQHESPSMKKVKVQ